VSTGSGKAMQDKKIVRSVTDSFTRLNETKSQVADSVDHTKVTKRMHDISKPSSPSSNLKKAGVALIVSAPDPITDVAGVALVATSYAVKRREPTKLEDLAVETRKILREIQSLRL
jgi:hypothetical protein